MLLLLVCVLPYLPPVQKFAVGKASELVYKSTGMRLSVERFRLRFPLGIFINNASLVTPEGDTLAAVGRFKADVALLPLLAGDVRVTGLSLQNASSVYRDTLAAVLVESRLDAFSARSATLHLNENHVSVTRAAMAGADVKLALGEPIPVPDTAAVDTSASAAWKFDLRRLDIEGLKFAMATSPNESEIGVELPEGLIRRAAVDLGTQNIEVESIKLTDGDYGYFTGRTVQQPERPDDDGKPSLWTVKAASVELADSRAAFGSMYGTASAGFDPQHIRAEHLALLVEDFLLHGSDISAQLRNLSLSERSGLRIMRAEAGFAMSEDEIEVDGLDLVTANSQITADARMGAGIAQMAASTPLRLDLSANVGAADLFLFAPFDASARRMLRGRSLTLGGNFRGTLGNLSLDRLAVEMPGLIDINASGRLGSLNAPENINGRISFDGRLGNVDFVKDFIADTALRRRIGFPRRMTLRGDAAFSPDLYDLQAFTLLADTGRLDAKARLDMRRKDFDADVRLTDFPLHSFLPHDSLGVATLSLTVSGQGLDPFDGMNAVADATIERLDYHGFEYRDMELSASLADGLLDGRIFSSNEALSLELDIGGELAPDRYAAQIKGDIWRADIQKMGFSESTLALTSQIDIRATALRDTTRMRFTLDAAIDSTVVKFGEMSQRVNLTTIKASAADTLTYLKLRSDDFALDFSSPMPIDSLSGGLGAMSREIGRQIRAQNLNADSLQKALPDINLTIKAGRGNFVRDLAVLRGMDFRQFTADVSTVTGKTFRIAAEVNGFATSGLTLDTLNLRIGGRDGKLNYALRLANRPGNLENLALIWVYGNAEGNAANLNVYQRNRADSVGFRFRLDAELLKDSVKISAGPQTMTLGYATWTVNEDNYLIYSFDGNLSADIRMRGPSAGKYVNLLSASMRNIPNGALRLEMEGIDTSSLTDLFPVAPPVGGIVSSNIAFGFNDGIIAAAGTLGVGDFRFRDSRVADIDAEIDFESDNTGRMVLDASVDIDKSTALTAKGFYTKEMMDIAVSIPRLPLSVAEAFMPDGVGALSGNMDGNINIKGTPAHPDIEADVGFTDGRIDVTMTGTPLRISEDRITVTGRRLSFNGFGLIAPNNRKIAITGNVDMSDFSRMRADLRVAGNNFQAVNSTHLGRSQVYGTAALDIDVTARGPFDGMTVRGGINMLGSTDVVYILRSQSQNVRNQRQDIVEFVVFADSLYTASADTTSRLRRTGVDMLVSVNIESGMRATLSLDEQNENRVEVTGSGSLSYSMNNQGDMRLTGRYTLSGGTVFYRLPVIPQTIFAVQDGSYVEWTGEPAAPSFNITATQTMNVALQSDSGSSRNVNFDISIAISGSLAAIAITFDVAAPHDLEIQNELSSMSAEQRMQQALSLLIYSQYTGLAYSSQGTSFDARDQINQFISRELNQWARNNLTGVDISMGINSQSDAAGNSYTNYSYSVSKRLFSDRVKVTIGGSVRDNATAQSVSENLIEDVIIEYRLTKRDNMFLKVYRYNTRESILEGEVTETGAGLVVRKRMNRFGDLFRTEAARERREARRTKRTETRELRQEEREMKNEK